MHAAGDAGAEHRAAEFQGGLSAGNDAPGDPDVTDMQAQAWSAPLSRELLVFNSFVRSLTRALRTLLEVTTLNMLLRNDARRGRDDLLDITISLPFQAEVNTGFGVLAKVYLDTLTHLNNQTRVRDPNAEGVKECKQMALEICEETFPGVKQPQQEVERGFRFWDIVRGWLMESVCEADMCAAGVDGHEAATLGGCGLARAD